MRTSIFISILSLISFGCRHHSNERQILVNHIPAVYLTQSEIENAGIKFDSARIFQPDSMFESRGVMTDIADNIAEIYAPVEGKVHFLKSGSVKKGMLLATIVSDQIVKIQQEYLDAKNQYDYYKLEYSRQGELTVENATTIKKMQIARRDFQSAETHYTGLRLQLKLMGILADSIRPDNMIASVSIYAPSEGSMKTIAKQGSFIAKGTLLTEISSGNRPLIRFTVSEKYFRKIRKEQVIHCWWPYDTLQKFSAIIVSVDDKFDPVSHTTNFFAQPEVISDEMLTGMTVNAAIPYPGEKLSKIDRKWIISNHKRFYVLLKDNGLFMKIPLEDIIEINDQLLVKDLNGLSVDSIVTGGHKKLLYLFK